MMTGQKLIPLPPEHLLYVGRDATQGKKYSYEHKLSLVIYLLRLNPRRRDCRAVQFNLRRNPAFVLDESLSPSAVQVTLSFISIRVIDNVRVCDEESWPVINPDWSNTAYRCNDSRS